ncbi:MAG: choice-of-anchor tandem repeat GloVer-containing protein, partial [Terriglobales bacterium]
MNSIYRQMKHLGMAAIALTMLAAVVLLAGMARPAQAQTYTPLYAFGAVDSTQNGPNGQLALGRDGNFYGTINQNISEIYRITPEGTETLLWAAGTSPNGSVCYSGLTLGSDGLLYGTCAMWNGWIDNGGIIFKYDPSQGQDGFTILYSFPYVENTYSPSPLTLGTDGNFYGTTYGSGYTTTWGTFFQITPAGKFTTLHVFQGYPANEPGEPSGPLTLGANGNFYGTSQAGGYPDDYNGGTIYEITPKGKVTLLYSFPNTGPYLPVAGVTQGADGKFYGTTFYGGTYSDGTIFQLAGKKVNILHNFNQSVDNAAVPNFPLTLATDGNFYSPSADIAGGGYGPESLFKITTKGVYTDLFNLLPGGCSMYLGADGCLLSSPMVLHPNGTFYGTTMQGGDYDGNPVDRGVFYSLNTGLKPYIILQFPLGPINSTLGIFGQGFSTATAVEFNGTAASFTVVSDTYLEVTIPVGATVGYVTVAEPSGTLKSAVKFTPKPASNPKPVITSLAPSSAIAGGAGFTLTVNGTGFVSASVVNWAGSPRTTTFVSDIEIQATINAADIAKAGTFKVTVTSPAPGGGTSAASNFVVDNPAPTLTSISPSSATHGGPTFTLTA